jgi:hypothetical protein
LVVRRRLPLKRENPVKVINGLSVLEPYMTKI